MNGIVRSICLSDRKGVPKKQVDSAELIADHGLAGDAHAGPWHRQVSLLGLADFTGMQRRLPDLRFGAFAENLVIEGIACGSLGLGSRLRFDTGAAVRISQIGKVCHTPCAISHASGDCILPRVGLFARAVAGGLIRVGDRVEVVEYVDRQRLQAVVLTVSDRCSRGLMHDTAGPAVGALLEGRLGACVYATEVIPDEVDVIAARLAHYSNGHSIDLVVTVGGTGFSPRDVTPEATRSVIERFAPGLDEVMRAAGQARTEHALLSRGVSGIRGGTLIVNVPGSERAACESIGAILPGLEHGLRKLRGDSSDCGRPLARSEE